MIKDLLLSKLNIISVEKNNLFYGQYRYCVKFSQEELNIIRGLDRDKIRETVNRRNLWRSYDDRSKKNSKEISEKSTNNLEIMCDLLNQYVGLLKFVVSFNTGYVYTNELTTITHIHQQNYIDRVRITEACVIAPPGAIALKNPRWTHRTFFRSFEITQHQKKALIEYFENRENIRISPGLTSWLKTSNSHWWDRFTHDHFFLDHNNDGDILFLNLIVPRITRHTLNIVAK